MRRDEGLISSPHNESNDTPLHFERKQASLILPLIVHPSGLDLVGKNQLTIRGPFAEWLVLSPPTGLALVVVVCQSAKSVEFGLWRVFDCQIDVLELLYGHMQLVPFLLLSADQYQH